MRLGSPGAGKFVGNFGHVGELTFLLTAQASRQKKVQVVSWSTDLGDTLCSRERSCETQC